MIRTTVSVFAFALVSLVGLAASEPAVAQNAVLREMYGRGVHAYYAGRYNDAYEMLSLAIDNGFQDPRAYYFRGIVSHATGRPEQAETDWQIGADLEADGRTDADIGQSLARIQGSTRLKLESIRQNARLRAAAEASARSEARYGEIQRAEARVLQSPPTPVEPPPAPPAVEGNPFEDDIAGAEPTVESDDALEGAIESAKAEAAKAAPASPAPAEAASPFGDAPADAADPFAPAGDAADPFAPAPSGGNDDPFAPSGGDDPFGGDPFGS